MNLEEAAALYREHALALIELAKKSKDLDAYGQDPEAMLQWCVLLLESLAELKWTTADIIERLTSSEGIELINTRLQEQKMKTTEPKEPLMIGSVYYEPPFDKDFFLKHKDIK